MVNTMAKKLNIRPTSGVYSTYKRLSYQPWTAIAEFVDNSTQSFYDHRDELLATKYYDALRIDINYCEDSQHGDYIVIYDNAFGMEWSDFQRAVVLDKPPKRTNGRNEFGMGLKTAACWFGSLWTVESTQLNSRFKYTAEMDINALEKYKSEEIDVQEETVSPKEHYTRITIRNLNKKIIGARTKSKVKELLSSIYREDIRSGVVKIYYDGNLLQFKEAPVFKETVNGMEKTWKKDIAFSIDHEGNTLDVSGFIAIRIPASLKDAGFTLMRRGRVIVGGSENNYRPKELFGESNLYPYQRLYGELHMDNWPVTQAKDSFDWHTSGLEEAFIEALSKHTNDYRKKAETIRVRETIQTNDLVKKAVDEFNKSGMLNAVTIEIVAPPIPVEDNNTMIPPAVTPNDISDLDTAETYVQEEIVDTGNDGVIFEGGSCVNFSFSYKGKTYLFHIIFDLSDPAAHWLLVEPKANYEYTITINMRHAFFKPLIEKKEFLPIMMRMAIALVLAEIESITLSHDGRIDPSEIRLKMNDILEEVRRGESTNG